MAIIAGSGKRLSTDDGIPYMWQSGDVTNTPNEVGIITASDGAVGDQFGYSVAVGSRRIVVGARLHDVGSNLQQGAAYIFDLDGNEVGIITASDGAAYDSFGDAVAVGSGRIVVGAYRDDNFTGSAYIFDLDGNEVGIITASDASINDRFGNSVAVGSGRIIVGASDDNNENGTDSGAIYIYDLDGNNEVKKIAPDGSSSDEFGTSVAVGSGRIIVGASGDNNENGTDSGAAYVYDLDGNYITKLIASDGAANDEFGISVASGTGRIVVGAHLSDIGLSADQGLAYIYHTPLVYTLYDVIELNYG